MSATENTFMPMIQLAFLFPLFIQINYDEIQIPYLDGKSAPFKILETTLSSDDNWIFILTIISGASSIISMAASRTSVYFTGRGKQTQKTFKRRAIIFGIVTLQILAKVMACQVFAFGVMGSYLWKYLGSHAILPTLFCLPMIMSFGKIAIIWIILKCLSCSCFHGCACCNIESLTFDQIKSHLLTSSFTLRRFDAVVSEDKKIDIGNKVRITDDNTK